MTSAPTITTERGEIANLHNTRSGLTAKTYEYGLHNQIATNPQLVY